MQITSNVMPIVIAGLMNGSFIVPARYIKNLTTEKIWLFHSIIGLAIIPWVMLLFTLPGTSIDKYFSLPSGILLFITVSGIIFGLGQVCFAYAIEAIGIALAFTINLGIGVTIGSMFIVFFKGFFLTFQGGLVTLAVSLIIISLILHYIAGKRHQHSSDVHLQKNQHYHRGWLLASLTGVASGIQNITFVMVAFYCNTQFQTSNSFWVWPPFLLAAAVPMVLGFLYKIKYEKKAGVNYQQEFSVMKNIVLVTVMGLFFTGSLAIYSNGMSKLTHQQQIIGWPAFMISIILTSQVWGWVYKKSAASKKGNILYTFISILLLAIAISILSIEV